jgi:GNAT superfamily N-acetyltransferase
MIENLKISLKEFLASREKNAWIGDDSFARIYVRKSKRFLESDLQDCLDLATIFIEPEYRGQGLFGKILKMFEEENPFNNILIESIVNKRLLEHVKKSGEWKPYMNLEDTFIKRIK